MLEAKTTEVFSLSDENKQEIKENAQKIKNYLVACGYDDCQDFIDRNDYDCYDYLGFAAGTLKDFLPFVKEELDYLDEDDAEKIVMEVDSVMENVKSCITKDSFTEDDAVIDFLDNKYSKEELIEKIIEFDNQEFLEILFNNNQE